MTYEDITNTVTEERIFEYYYGCSIIIKTKRYPNIARGGDSPTCGFIYDKSNRVIIKDFKEDKCYSAWDFVKLMYNCSAKEALEIIARDLNITSQKPIKKRYVDVDLTENKNAIQKQHYKVIPRAFLPIDIDFWGQFNITEKTLNKYEVKPVQDYYRYDYSFAKYTRYYSFDWSKELCYVYPYLNERDDQEVKIYRPNNKQNKWHGNANVNTIFGLPQLLLDDVDELEKKNVCFIASGLKDLMCLSEMGFDAICGNSESSFVPEYIITLLKSVYKEIIIIFDIDETGVYHAIKNSELYNIKYCELYPIDLNQKEKDVADYCKSFGLERTKDLIKLNLLETYNIEL